MKHGMGGRVAVREIASVLQAKSQFRIREMFVGAKTVVPSDAPGRPLGKASGLKA